MRKLLSWRRQTDSLINSTLYDQDTFYRAFLKDISLCRSQLIIESPFITERRMNALLPTLQRLRRKGVHIIVNTRNPEEHEGIYQDQANEAVAQMQACGIKVLYTAGHHRKLAIIDSCTVWEGSLNILSFNDSCEIMRRITSTALAQQLIQFIAVGKYTRGVQS